ncbi:MAG TPA: tetratricopeptide repeat protein, partial [Dongiaceae bacterium]|nr:tetratricopeptide repeat protein [Dongiaceae bacterium]
LYNHGLGVQRDDAAAVHWYQMAADQNFPLAMRNLANMYASGHGVPFDKAQADFWFQKAADAGDPVAIKRLAALSPSATQFAAAPDGGAPASDSDSGQSAATPTAPAPEPMTVAGGNQPIEANPAPEPEPEQTVTAAAPAETAPSGGATAAAGAAATEQGDQAPQYGETGTSAAAPAAAAAPATTQQAAVTPPPPASSDPANWLIGMWQGPSLGCPPGGGMEFVPGEARSYYEGQIAVRLPAKYEVQGDRVTVTSTGVDGVGHSYQYERTGPNTLVITSVPADMPQSMIGIEHRRCASPPLAAAAAPASQPLAAAPAAKPAAAAQPAPATQPAPKPVPVKPVAEAAPPEPMPGAQEAAANPQPPAPGTPQAGWDAFGRGDYKGALAVWQPLAEKGDVAMQLLVGSIYDYGQGVPQDDAEAAKWYEHAAMQGSAKGQYELGALYARSPQVKNPVEGYKWLTIAAHSLSSGPQDGITEDQATTLRTLLQAQMSEIEIEKAKQEAEAFKATKG